MMHGFAQAAAAQLRLYGPGALLPQLRKIELYTNNLEVHLYAPDTAARANPWAIPQVMGALSAFSLLDAFLEREKPAMIGRNLRQRFAALQPSTRVERLTAQVYRILKIVRQGVSAAGCRLTSEERVFQINYVENPFAFALYITYAGLELLGGYVAVLLEYRRYPHPEAYVEAMLSEYYDDIVDEILYLSDEDGTALNYRKRLAFNRHFRFQCCTAKYRLTEDRLVIDIGERYADKQRWPIDFYLMLEGAFHIIPCEALTDNAIRREDLPRWRVREPEDCEGLPVYDLRLESKRLNCDALR